MTTDDERPLASVYSLTPPPPPPGLRPPRPRRRRIGRTAAGLAVVLGTGAGAAAVTVGTAGSAPSPGPSGAAPTAAATAVTGKGGTAPGARGRYGPGGGVERVFPGGLMGPMGALGGGVVRGTFSVRGSDGAYQTIAVQVGTAEQVSPGQITVKSADGVSQAYRVVTSTVVDADYEGILSVKVTDRVSVWGTVSGSTFTARRVVDLTQVGEPPGPRGGPGGPGPSPLPPPPAA